MDLYDLAAETALWWFHIGERLRRAPDLQIARIPALTRPEVVDDEGDPGTGRDITELLRLAHPIAADVDSVVAADEKGDRGVANDPGRRNSRQPAESLPCQKGSLGPAESVKSH